jgi:hypothetical protein
MKKLLIILAVGFSSIAYSQQVNPTGTVSNLSISQVSVCLCDSVDFNFIYRNVYPMPAAYDFSIWAKNGSKKVLVHTFDYTDIYKMGTSPVGNFYNDTIYFSRMYIPCDLLSKLDLGSFNSITVQFTFDYMNGPNEGLGVVNCTVGIDEYELNDATPIYYNFSGQIVEPKQGELLIKQVGKTRIKVLIQ